ncbi:hypothetical protein [Zavarzinella formosa]|uniref:hypothetical protein n=1 Tax=Zavarzinella formosa TaxID=360055 RepID=UPI0002FEF88C|nr:hypothetical protein [Zavarzinella formosa]
MSEIEEQVITGVTTLDSMFPMQLLHTMAVLIRCDDCGIGEMTPTGIMFMTHPPQYQHKCDKCGTERTFDERYPKVITRT